jgi:2-keto-4-pentenoate hydratase/2-oxohepta-3-ene-1,7-dioic acid hydratase in catechol pathway
MNDCDLVETMQLTQQSVGKFVALGGTFTTHQEEDNNTYRWPDLWVVPSEGVISEDETIQLPDRVDKVKPGSEITAVIGEDIYRASEEEAWDAISGFTISNDVIALGDPGGASVFLDDAAEVTCTIESIGELTNPIERL